MAQRGHCPTSRSLAAASTALMAVGAVLAMVMTGVLAIAAGPAWALEDAGNDDTILVGSDVRIAGPFRQVHAMGFRVKVAGPIMGDVRVRALSALVTGSVAGSVHLRTVNGEIEGVIAEDLEVEGINLEMQPTGAVLGDLIFFGTDAELEGRIAGDVIIEATSLTLNGTIEGNAIFKGESIRIGPEARIAGDLIIRAYERPVIPPEAVITGETYFEPVFLPFAQWIRAPFEGLPAIDLPFPVLLGLGIFLGGVMMVFGFSNLTERSLATWNRRPIVNFLAGLLWLCAVPILALGLIITIIGLPIGLMTLAFYPVMLGAGLVVSVLALSRLTWRLIAALTRLWNRAQGVSPEGVPEEGPERGFDWTAKGPPLLLHGLFSVLLALLTFQETAATVMIWLLLIVGLGAYGAGLLGDGPPPVRDRTRDVKPQSSVSSAG